MKQVLSLALLLSAVFSLRAQAPINDDFNCATMINLGLIPSCQPNVYTNTNATPSVIATVDTVSCFQSGMAQHDVWFRFQCPTSLLDVRVTIAGIGADPLTNPEFAIFRGDCVFDGPAELDCVSAGLGQTDASLDLFGLTPNVDYYIRVSDWSPTAAPNWGDFTVCVDSIPPIVNITQGSSSLCSGTLYDSGGPNGDYGPNEDHTFTICPDQPSECITFSLNYYNLEPTANPFGAGEGDQLYFYDGPNANSPLLAALDGSNFSAQDIAGGGGVCFMVQAKSGCLTVVFESDAEVEEEGWMGTWQCSSDPCPAQEVLKVDTSITAAQIVDAVSTGGAQVTVTDIKCDPVQYGTFHYASVSNDLQMDKGIILTSGQAKNAEGPNDLTGLGSIIAPSQPDDVGDPDLNYLSNLFGSGSESLDACVLELDVFAATNEVVFEYVFGSEEYPEYIFNSGGFNDIFAFLVSGPGIVGDPNLTNNALNIAVLPNSSTPVQIDSVNNQANWQYYRNNELSQTIQYDGLTSDYLGIKKSLTARVPVIPCNTYHLKLAISDRGDEAFDSGVFVSEIKAGSPDIAIQFASGINYFIESCSGNQDTLFISLSKPATTPTTFNISLGGTATQGVDYQLNIPPSITFAPGQTTLAFPIIPLPDAIAEGTETILINIARDYGCGEVILKTLVAEIQDGVVVNVDGGDTLKVCKGDFLQLHATGASSYFWQPTGAVNNAYVASPVTSPTQSQWISVTGAVGSCEDVDSVYIRVIAPGIAVTALSDPIICLGGSVALQAIPDPPDAVVTWNPVVGLDDPNSLTPVASPTFPVTYSASVTQEGCTVSGFVTVTVDTLKFPQLINDTTLCQNYPIALAAPLSSTTKYDWTPTTGLDNPHAAAPVATPGQSTVYNLVATSQHGACSQTGSVSLGIILADIDIKGDAYQQLCLGAIDTLQATASPAGSLITWTPNIFLNTASGPTVIATPTETVTYTATYSIVSGNTTCVEYDSVKLQVDSLPDLSMYKVMDKNPYCQGDTVYLLLNHIYDPGNFPGPIEYQWLQHGQFLSPENEPQLVFIAHDTFTYELYAHLRGCYDTTRVFIPVYTPPNLTAVVAPPVICPGQSAQITVTPDPKYPNLQYLWDPTTSGTLNCTNCLNPIANPIQTTLYKIGIPNAPCPAGISVLVNVEDPPVLDLPQNPVICASGSVLLNNKGPEPGVTYDWSPGLFLSDSTIANPVATATQTITYHVVAQGQNCSTDGDVTVQYFNATINAGQDQTICEGEPVTLTANVTGTSGAVTWLPGGQTGPTLTVTPSGDQQYTAALSYGIGCNAADSVLVIVNKKPELNLNPNTSICKGDTVALALPHTTNATFQWTPPAGLDNPSSATPKAFPGTTTTYNVVATDLNCVSTGTVTVTVSDAQVNAGQDQSICYGESVMLEVVTSGSPVDSVIWMPGHRLGSSITVAPVINSVYTATIYYGVNCSKSDLVTVNVSPPITVDLSSVPDSQDSICDGTTVKLKAALVHTGAVTLVWLADGTPIQGANKDSLEVTPANGTNYTLVATDANGCTASSTPISFKTKRCFHIPNAFTPNGDSANDTFGPIGAEGSFTIQSFHIYNRWGQKVFEATESAQKWDGRANGKDASSDVYVYTLSVRFANGVVEDYHGEVTLLR